MSSLSENLKHSYNNFNEYAKYGTVPTVTENNSQVPQNSFYRSVHYIDGVLGPIKDMIVGVNKDVNTSTTTLGRREKGVCGVKHNELYSSFANLFLVFYTGFAYLMYLPHKLFSHLRGTNRPESLVGYTNNLQNKAEQHGETCAKFLSLVLSYIVSAVIWTVALIVTPLTWAVDKVSSRFSEVKEPEMLVNNEDLVK
ncbi:hypothetical protein [Wolbachia pipientis]|uniref:hypothetical protein n=1 Tax=Wolbachia pipientis TaxID=955 RepID=UPI0025A3CAFE|nr:hypothetical protein [Wolbachia pipientis]MDM8334844.1 hypothetical protein [Wolbachia pipientis]